MSIWLYIWRHLKYKIWVDIFVSSLDAFVKVLSYLLLGFLINSMLLPSDQLKSVEQDQISLWLGLAFESQPVVNFVLLVGGCFLFSAFFGYLRSWYTTNNAETLRRNLMLKVLEATLTRGYDRTIEVGRLLAFAFDQPKGVFNFYAGILNCINGLIQIFLILILAINLISFELFLTSFLLLLVLALAIKEVKQLGGRRGRSLLEANKAALETLQGFFDHRLFLSHQGLALAALDVLNYKLRTLKEVEIEAKQPSWVILEMSFVVIGVILVFFGSWMMFGDYDNDISNASSLIVLFVLLQRLVGAGSTSLGHFFRLGVNRSRVDSVLAYLADQESLSKWCSVQISGRGAISSANFKVKYVRHEFSRVEIRKGLNLLSGPSGRGKSVWSEALIGQLLQRSNEPSGLEEPIGDELLGIKIDTSTGFLFQRYSDFRHFLKCVPFLDRDLFRKLWEQFGLAHEVNPIGSLETVEDDYALTMSRGQVARAFIALALSCKPDILVLDEVLTTVSVDQEQMILESITNIIPEALVFVVTHRSLRNDVDFNEIIL